MKVLGPFDIDTPTRPMHRDEAIAAMRNCPRPFCHNEKAEQNLVEEMKDWYNEVRNNALATIEFGEWFDFGPIEPLTILDAAHDAMPFLEEGLIGAPYENTVFRVRLYKEGSDIKGGIEFIIAWEMFNRKQIADLRREVFPRIPAHIRRDMEMAMLQREQINRVYTMVATEDRLEMVALGMFYGKRHSCVTMASDLLDFYEGADENKAATVATSLQMGLWTILNTKNIEKRVVEPPPKLNKARIKRGKLPLSVVTYIKGIQYEQAAKATREMKAAGEITSEGKPLGHERRSPRMHLRRAHIRTYKSDGHRTAVAAMIVNADHEAVERIEYRRA